MKLNRNRALILSNFILLNLVLLTTLIAGCTKSANVQCDSDLQFLSNRQEIGVAVNSLPLFNSVPYQQIVTDHFKRITAGNEMKPDALQPFQGQFDFERADDLVYFAETNNMSIHGHTLLWHQQIPYWMENFEGTREEWKAMMKNHIQTVVHHFKGKVKSWDVINEAFYENGTLRNTIWKQNIGPEYLDLAFKYAHEADPNAVLFYNDFNLAINPVKRNAVLRFFQKLKANGVPIHGIGLQMHISIGFPENNEINRALIETSDMGFLVHLSELDVTLNPLSKSMPTPTTDDLKRQADKYSVVFNYFNKLPEHLKFGITIWGVDDGTSWIPSYFNRDDYPLLFDKNFEPKPAFCRLISTL